MVEQKSKIDLVVTHPQLQSEALLFFTQGDLKNFDALVGEQACQIRATMITDLYDKYVDSIKNNTFGLEMLTGEEKTFLVLTYFLTKFKQQEHPLEQKELIMICRIDLQKIMDFFHMQKNSAVVTLHEVQVKVAELSVNYLNLLLNTKLSSHQELKPLLMQQHLSGGRVTVGCYISMMLMYYDAFKNNRPIVIKVERECKNQVKTINFIYTPNLGEKDCYIQQTAQSIKKTGNQPVLIIEGKSTCTDQACRGCFEHENFSHKLQQTIKAGPQGLLRVLCANAAQHAQFIGQDDLSYDFSQAPQLGQTYAKSKEIAEHEGYSLHNPSTFLVQHIYASTLAKEIYSFFPIPQ